MMTSISVFAAFTLGVFVLATAELKFGGQPVRRNLGVVMLTSLMVSAIVTQLLRSFGHLP